MAFKSFYTDHYRLPFFGDGHLYSAEADRQRFVTLDRNLESYVGIVGVGIIQGWLPTHSSGLSVDITWGDGFVGGYYSESGWDVKKREAVLPTDIVLEEGYYVDEDTGQIYDKIEYTHTMTLPDNADVFIYAYRNANYTTATPYLDPNNDSPVVETSNTLAPSRTAASFSYTGTQSSASRSGRVYIGQVTTRNGLVTEVDISDVRSLANFEGAMREFADFVIKGHRHGGDGTYDPQAIRLQTDRRDMILSNAVGDSIIFIAKNSDVSTAELDHYHTYSVDSSGNGITVDTYGDGAWHFHEISAFVVGGMKGSVSVEGHSHELDMPEDDSDGWSQSDPVQIYINGEPYYGDNATVTASSKQVSFVGDVTVKYRKYGIDHDGWIFESEERSLYRFMLRAALAYAQEHDGNNIIVPDPTTPITAMENQALAGDSRLIEEGDTFTFVPDAADNVTVTLLEAAHVDQVEIEILTNSEVTGSLPQDNILYIPASKIVSGKFEPEMIPMLSHLGRFLEECGPRATRARSVDGRVYESERDDAAGNVKIVYSAADDGGGSYIIGTSDGVYRKPAGGAYLFFVNGVSVVTETGDIRERLEEAALRCQSKTGVTVAVDASYDAQIAEAEIQVTAVDDYYSFQGNRNEAVDGGFDTIWLFFVSQYRLTEYGYETTRLSGEVLPDEEIVREIEQEVDPDSETDPIPLYLVRNDFHKWTPKKMFVEHNLVSGYDGSVADKFYSVTSSEIMTSVSVDKEWKILSGSGIDGYIYDFSKSYSGIMVAATSSGMKVSTHSSGTGFRHVKSPVFGSDSRAVIMGYGDRFISASTGTVMMSDDFGQTWLMFDLASSDILYLFHDPSVDKTTVQSGHFHTISVNGKGDGQTSADSGHYHQVDAGVIAEESGHTHGPIRQYFAMSRDGEIFTSLDSGSTWAALSSVPSSNSEWGAPFAAFGNVYVPARDGLALFDGVTWTTISPFEGVTYSAQWSYENDSVLLGSVNAMYSYDGTDATLVYSDTGLPVPKLYEDLVPKKFGFMLNNAYNSYDMGGDILLGTNIDIVDSFEQFYPILDGWPDGIGYDLYINDRLVKSTKKGIDRSGRTYVDVSNVSVINFSVSTTLSAAVSIGDMSISTEDVSLFPDSGTVSVLLAKTDGQMFAQKIFYDYYAKSGNKLLLSSPSLRVSGTGLPVSYTPDVGGDDDVVITVYDGKITNIGVNTHEAIENMLSIEDSGLPKRLADVYESNLLHLIIAAKYAFPSVDSEMENMFLTTFDYNFIPGDPDNIDEHIDRDKSDLASLSLYSRDALNNRSSAVRRVIKGFGRFVNKIFAASNVGFYMMDSSVSFEANWVFVDVDSSTSAYDVMQYDEDTVYVATDKGLYINNDVEFSSWTAVDADRIGGIPTRIVPRWNSLVDEELGIDYWWGDWDGVVHDNEDLVNTIIVSGDGFVSHSDDRGISWLAGKFYDTDGNRVEEMSPVSYTLLRDGSMATCARNVDGTLWGVYVSTGTGSRWTEKYSMSSVLGTVNLMRVLDNLNVIMGVTFDSDSPADNSLVGRELVMGADTYVIVSNSGNYVTVFGDMAISSAETRFEIRPWKMNVIHEDSEKRVSLGSSAGLLWDNGGFFSDDRSRDGSVSSVGNVATIDSINISGSVGMLVPLSDKTIISATIDKHVVVDELVGMSVKFSSSSVPDMEIISNGLGRYDSTVSITVTGDTSALIAGDLFVIEGVDSVRIYVTYSGIVSQGDLSGGFMVLSPEEYDYGLTRENYPIMKILSNTDSYINVSRKFDGPETADPIASLVPGAIVLASNSDGTVPVNVDFDTQRSVNEIRNNLISVNGSEAFPPTGAVMVDGNDEISMTVNESYSGTASDDTSATYSVFNTLIPGEDFFLSSLPFVSRPEFNDTRSSVSSGHYHSYSSVPGPITGVVSGFGTVTSFGVELLLDGAVGMDNSTVSGNAALFAGDTLLAYRRDNPSVKYRLEVVEHNSISESITVARLDGAIDLATDDSKKVGEGYYILLNTNGYGETVSTEFTDTYIVSTAPVTVDALIGDDTITVSSTNNMGVGIKLRLTDDTGVSFSALVDSIVGNDVTLSAPLTVDLLVENSARAEILYGKWHVGDYSVASPVTQGDSSVTISDASLILAGDIIEIADGSGMSDSHVVLTVADPVVNLVTAIGRDYAAGSTTTFMRYNHSGTHSHLVRRGQFDLVTIDSVRHGHYLSPLVQEVIDMKTFYGTSYIVGSGHVIYSSGDNGESWLESSDLSVYPEFTPLPTHLSGIYAIDDTTVACTASSGYIIYQSGQYVRFVG